MKSKIVIMLVLAVTLVGFAGTLFAHHGANLYDSTKAVMMKGTITQFEWGNPHNQIYFDVKDDKGNVTHWVTSTEPPAVMTEQGWTRKSLKPGDEITAYVYAAKNGAPVGNLQKIVKADGTELRAGGGGPAAGAPGANAEPAPKP